MLPERARGGLAYAWPSRVNRPCEERIDEAIQRGCRAALDCIATLAMTSVGQSPVGFLELVVARETLRREPARGAAGHLPHVNVPFGSDTASVAAHLPR